MRSLVRRPIATILSIIITVFLVVLGFYYLQEGSMEGAGARMDRTLNEAGDVASESAVAVAEKTEEIINDVADGPDNTPPN